VLANPNIRKIGSSLPFYAFRVCRFALMREERTGVLDQHKYHTIKVIMQDNIIEFQWMFRV
jgi:hypothetical protein